MEDHSKRRPRLHNHQRGDQPRNTRREGKLYLVKFCLAAEMMEPRERLRFDALHAARALACLPFLPLDINRKSWAIYLFREGHDQDQRQKEYPSIALQGLCSRHGSRCTHGMIPVTTSLQEIRDDLLRSSHSAANRCEFASTCIVT